MHKLNLLEFEDTIVKLLKDNLQSLKVSVLPSFPSSKQSYPLITTNVYETGGLYGANRTKFVQTFRLSLKMWANNKVELTKISQQVVELLESIGFIMTIDSEISVDNTNGKIYKYIMLEVMYNKLNGNYERSY